MATSATVSRKEEPVVFVIDDDPSVREALADLLRSINLKAETFLSAHEFLQRKPPDTPGCILLDVQMPGMSGLDFQRALMKLGVDLPIIFISGYGDVPTSVQAMKSGAIEFLTKPLNKQALLEAIQAGLERDRARRVLRQNL